MAIRVSLGHMEPHFGGRGGRRGSARAPLERAMVVSYRLSIVTIVLSVTIRPQFAIECLRHSNQQGWVTLGPNLGCSPWSRPTMFGSAESEHPRLTNVEIISDVFQPMWSQSTNVTDRRTDGQTNNMRSQYRALHQSASRGKNRPVRSIEWIGNNCLRLIVKCRFKFNRFRVLIYIRQRTCSDVSWLLSAENDVRLRMRVKQLTGNDASRLLSRLNDLILDKRQTTSGTAVSGVLVMFSSVSSDTQRESSRVRSRVSREEVDWVREQSTVNLVSTSWLSTGAHLQWNGHRSLRAAATSSIVVHLTLSILVKVSRIFWSSIMGGRLTAKLATPATSCW